MDLARNKVMSDPKGNPVARKPDLALVLEGGPPKKLGPPMGDMDEEAGEMAEPSDDEAADPSLVEAAGAVRAAFHGQDDEELAKTLKGFLKLCGEY